MTQAFLRRLSWSGGVATLASTVVAMALSRRATGDATAAIDAVSHMAWGGRPPTRMGPHGGNLATGLALHASACVFWATLFEGMLGRKRRARPLPALLGGAATAATAYVVDYKLVPRRFQPAFEAALPPQAFFAVYAAMAAGLAAGALWSARLARERKRTAQHAGEHDRDDIGGRDRLPRWPVTTASAPPAPPARPPSSTH